MTLAAEPGPALGNAWSILVAPAPVAASWDSPIRVGYGTVSDCSAFLELLDEFLIEPWTADELLLRLRLLMARRFGAPRIPELPPWIPGLQHELYTLLGAAPIPVSRLAIARDLDLPGAADSRAVDMLVARLRRNLRQAEIPCTVHTIRGVGYRLVCG